MTGQRKAEQRKSIQDFPSHGMSFTSLESVEPTVKAFMKKKKKMKEIRANRSRDDQIRCRDKEIRDPEVAGR
jgi:hypothetical protein